MPHLRPARPPFLIAAIAAGFLMGASPAQSAAETEKPVKGGVPGTNIDMPFLMAPITDADGMLNGYAYISSRLTAASAAAALEVREKIPFMQDVFVRDVNRTAVVSPSDNGAVDIPAMEARLLADARTVMGADKIKRVTVCTVQIALLHPKQTAQDSSAARNPVKSRCDS